MKKSFMMSLDPFMKKFLEDWYGVSIQEIMRNFAVADIVRIKSVAKETVKDE